MELKEKVVWTTIEVKYGFHSLRWKVHSTILKVESDTDKTLPPIDNGPKFVTENYISYLKIVVVFLDVNR